MPSAQGAGGNYSIKIPSYWVTLVYAKLITNQYKLIYILAVSFKARFVIDSWHEIF